jgi:hypothetical protein
MSKPYHEILRESFLAAQETRDLLENKPQWFFGLIADQEVRRNFCLAVNSREAHIAQAIAETALDCSRPVMLAPHELRCLQSIAQLGDASWSWATDMIQKNQFMVADLAKQGELLAAEQEAEREFAQGEREMMYPSYR